MRFSSFPPLALILLLLLLLLVPARCLAQDGPAEDLLTQHFVQLSSWLDAYTKWEAWTVRWGNRVAYNSAGAMIKDRPARPEPPEWLWEECRKTGGAEGKLREGCTILAHWDDITRYVISRKAVGGVTPTDAPVKTSFLQRIHLTGGWVPAQLPAPKVYLVAGMQVGLVEVGRATLPGLGAGIMAISDGNGGYEWKPASVLSLGYRLTSFPFPIIDRQSHLHINVARVTVHGARNIPLGLDPSQNLIGFSLTFGSRR